MKNRREQPLTFGGWNEAQLRTLVCDTTEAYLAPDFEPRQRISAKVVANRQGHEPPTGPTLIKVERYALAAAAIRKVTGRWVEGTGVQARIRPEWIPKEPPYALDDPFDNMTGMLRKSYSLAAKKVEKDPRTRVAYFLGRYNRLSIEHDHATAGLIRIGGTMPVELKYYTRTTARAFAETPLTQNFSEARRLSVAHQMLSLLTARASQHLDSVVEGPFWYDVEAVHPHIEEIVPTHTKPTELDASAAGEAALFRMLGPDGAQLFPLAMELWEGIYVPLLKCPAHQRPWGTESALQTQSHAGINYAGDQGLYHPSLVVPGPPSMHVPSR
jgi:hypothetical protein